MLGMLPNILLAAALGSSASLSLALLFIEIVIVALIIFVLGRMIIGLLANSVLGLIAIFAINLFFGIGIPYSIPVLIVTALFGLPAVLILVILKLLGIPI